MLDTAACTCTTPEAVPSRLDAIAAGPLVLPPAPEEPGRYRRITLRLDEREEIALARWNPGSQSRLHGHGDSTAVYRVLSGVVEEERYVPEGDGFRYEKVTLHTGDETHLPAGGYHTLRAIEPSVTLHAYSPPPVDATAAVPEETLRLLDEARERTEQTLPFVQTVRHGLVETVEALVEGWAEREARANREGQLRMPTETLEEMRSSGILAAPIPEELGGWGASLAETVTAVRTIARRAPAAALALVMPLGNAATTRIPTAVVPVAHRGTLIEGQHWIAEQVLRGMILAVANSEPGAGGELSNTKTIAKLGCDGVFRLTGRKSFATFGRDADYFLCAARTRDGSTRDVVDGYFVAKDAPGLVVDDRWNPVGMRPTASVGLTLEDAEAEVLMGYPGCLEGVNARHWSTILFAAVFVGVGEGALREGVASAPADGVWARSALAEQALNLDAAAGFLEAIAGDERIPLPADVQKRVQRVKTYAARVAVEVATHAAMVCGGRCYTPDHPVFRFLCDALAGPLLRPPLPKAMDAIAAQLFSSEGTPRRAAA